MDELRKEHRRQQRIHDRQQRQQQRNDLRHLKDQLEDEHQQTLRQLRDEHRREILDKEDEHRQDRQDITLQRKDAEIRRLRHQLRASEIRYVLCSVHRKEPAKPAASCTK